MAFTLKPVILEFAQIGLMKTVPGPFLKWFVLSDRQPKHHDQIFTFEVRNPQLRAQRFSSRKQVCYTFLPITLSFDEEGLPKQI